ncbi:MAG: hypothetical protein FAF03_05515 [Epsilonproteobacteria bacterium]|nr:hypothetical protein [Campylobacterota bacterium]
MIVFVTNSVLLATELMPLPLKVEADAQKVALGKKLFLDPILNFRT